MKHIGSTFQYMADRDRDLLRAYREYTFLCNTINKSELMTKIVNSPSKRFWVSESRAAIVVSGMMKGYLPPNISRMKKEMYEEIFRRVLALRKKYPRRSIPELAAMVSQQKAPKFYLTPGSANVILHRIFKKCRRNRLEKLSG